MSAQAQYSLLERDTEREVIPACRRFGLGLLPYFPLANGLLTGKYLRGMPPPDGSRLAGRTRLLADAPNREDTIFRSKAVGEPPLMLAISVLHAIRDACASAESGAMPILVAPATPESILHALASLEKSPATRPIADLAGAGA